MKRTYVLEKTQRRFVLNALAFFRQWNSVGFGAEFSFEFRHCLLEICGQVTHRLCVQGRGYAVERFSDAARDTGQRVAVAAQRDGVAEAVFQVRPVQKGTDGLRHGALTGGVPLVCIPDAVAGEIQVVAEFCFDSIFYFFLVLSVPGQEDAEGRGLCSLDAFRMVVRAGSGEAGCFQGLFLRAERPSHGPYAHGRAVAAAAVGDELSCLLSLPEPFAETSAETAQRTPVVGGVTEIIRRTVPAVQQPVGRGEGQDAVIGISLLRGEEGKLLGLDVMELVDAAYDVAEDASNHEVKI